MSHDPGTPRDTTQPVGEPESTPSSKAMGRSQDPLRPIAGCPVALALVLLLAGCSKQVESRAPVPISAEPEVASKGTARPEADANDDAWEGEDESLEAGGGEPPDQIADAPKSSRDLTAISAQIKANRQPVRDCYQAARKENKELAGDVVIRIVIAPNGKVKQAELNKERSTLTEASVVGCAIRVIGAIDFGPSPNQMETVVNYPYNFTP